MLVNVTQSHIEDGIRWSSTSCPIALALCDHHDNVIVGSISLVITKDDMQRIFSLPENARDFIWRFDHGDMVNPFAFELREL